MWTRCGSSVTVQAGSNICSVRLLMEEAAAKAGWLVFRGVAGFVFITNWSKKC
jgi:hypothetical protein